MADMLNSISNYCNLKLTLEIQSVRFGGGSFGFPRPKSLFILLKIIRCWLWLTKKPTYHYFQRYRQTGKAVRHVIKFQI